MKKFIFFPQNFKNEFHICIATEGIFYRGCSQLSNEIRYDSVGPLQETLEQKENGPISVTHAVDIQSIIHGFNQFLN